MGKQLENTKEVPMACEKKAMDAGAGGKALRPEARFWNWTEDGEDGARTLRLEGPIDEDDVWGDVVTPKAFRDELHEGNGDITVWINSPGGSVFAAAEIYTMLRD